MLLPEGLAMLGVRDAPEIRRRAREERWDWGMIVCPLEPSSASLSDEMIMTCLSFSTRTISSSSLLIVMISLAAGMVDSQ